MRSIVPLAWFLLSTGPAWSAAAPWSALPGLPGAEIQAVAFDPAAAGIALAGAAGGQIFRSTNGGTTWTRHTLGTPGAHINAIVFAPATPGLVYAATSCLYACNGAIYVSNDHGATWAPTAAQPNFPSISGNALLVTSAGNLLALVGNNLALSTDGGQSWQYPLIQNRQQIYGFSGLAITGAGASTLWAAGFDASLNNDTFSSTDGGQTWTPHVISGLPAATYTGSVAVNPAGNAIFLTYSNGADIAGLAASTDGGNTFSPVTQGLPAEILPAGTPNWMAFDPATPSHVVLGTASQGGPAAMAESTDGGLTWSQTGTRIPDELAAGVVAFRPASATMGEALFAGSDALFAGAASGARLAVSSDGLDRGSLLLVAEDGASNSGLFAVTPNGVYHSADDGQAWHGVSGWKGSHYVVQAARQLAGNGALYVLTGENRILRTSDQGAIWTDVTPPYASRTTTVGGVYPDATRPGTIYVATYSKDFFVSNDAGTTWTKVILPEAIDIYARINGKAIVVSGPKPSGRLLAFAEGNDYLESDDFGLHWKISSLSGTVLFDTLAIQQSAPYAAVEDDLNYALPGQTQWTYRPITAPSSLLYSVPGRSWLVFAGTPDGQSGAASCSVLRTLLGTPKDACGALKVSGDNFTVWPGETSLFAAGSADVPHALPLANVP